MAIKAAAIMLSGTMRGRRNEPHGAAVDAGGNICIATKSHYVVIVHVQKYLNGGTGPPVGARCDRRRLLRQESSNRPAQHRCHSERNDVAPQVCGSGHQPG